MKELNKLEVLFVIGGAGICTCEANNHAVNFSENSTNGCQRSCCVDLSGARYKYNSQNENNEFVDCPRDPFQFLQSVIKNVALIGVAFLLGRRFTSH